MFCTNCGNQIDDDMLYCIYCGDKILLDDSAEQGIEKIVDNIDYKDNYVSKGFDITFTELSIILLMIGLAISIINIIIVGKDTSYIIGQIIFGLIFVISGILLWKSKKIGGIILIPFVSLKMISSIYYYLENYNGYLIKNLIIDEIFYLAIISLIILGWKNLK